MKLFLSFAWESKFRSEFKIFKEFSCAVITERARVFISNRVPDEGTIGSEETRLLGKVCKCFSRNPAQVNDGRIDQAVGLYY